MVGILADRLPHRGLVVQVIYVLSLIGMADLHPAGAG